MKRLFSRTVAMTAVIFVVVLAILATYYIELDGLLFILAAASFSAIVVEGLDLAVSFGLRKIRKKS